MLNSENGSLQKLRDEEEKGKKNIALYFYNF